MPNEVLLLWLEGPMQSWGTRSRWDVRDTGLEPTKSGVIGLLGASMGLARSDKRLEDLDAKLAFGVRVDRPGIVATDYHTVTGYHRTAAGDFKHSGGTATTLQSALKHDPATIVSPRDYLHDAIFLVVLEGPAELIEECRYRLANPVWPLFLGRKGCPPTRPLIAQGQVQYASAELALLNHPRHAKATSDRLAAYVEDPNGNLERQDALRINPLRMYDFRSCRYLEVDPPCSSPA